MFFCLAQAIFRPLAVASLLNPPAVDATMSRSPTETAEDIRALRIQGARRVARAALAALNEAAQASSAPSKGALYEDLLQTARMLEETRPTEPMMRNALEDSLRYALVWIRTHQSLEPKELVEALEQHQHEILDEMEAAVGTIAKIGAAEIPDHAAIMVHCHSTTVVRLLTEAQKLGKHPKVTCLETRPLYQGRLTARELAAAGVDVRLAVDSAAGSLMNKMDGVLVGADAITSEGDLVNKIGTYGLAQMAHLHSVRFLCVAELYKYDPLTRFKGTESIEQRAAGEVWGSGRYRQEKNSEEESRAGKNLAHDGPLAPLPIPQNLKIINPAFDRTPARFISAYITEAGLTPPGQLAILAERKLKNSPKIEV